MIGELHALKIETESLQADQHSSTPTAQDMNVTRPAPPAGSGAAHGAGTAWCSKRVSHGQHSQPRRGPHCPTKGRRAGGLCYIKCTRDSPQQGDMVSLGVLCHPAHAKDALPSMPAGIIQLS